MLVCLQNLALHAPAVAAVTSKYVQFSEEVAPHPIVTLKKNNILSLIQLHSDFIIDFTYKHNRHQNQMHMFLHWYHPCLNTLLCTKKFSFHTKIASKTVNINYELTLCSRCHFLNHH